MNTEQLRGLLEESKNVAARGLQMIEMAMMNSKDKVQPDDWLRLESALAGAREIIKNTQGFPLEPEKIVSLTPRISDEQIKALETKVREQKNIYRNKCSRLRHLEDEIERKRGIYTKAYRDKTEEPLSSIRNLEKLIATLSSRLNELEKQGPDSDSIQENLLLPRVIVQPVTSLACPGELGGGTERNFLKVPVSYEGDSRESGISEGSSPDFQISVEDNYRRAVNP